MLPSLFDWRHIASYMRVSLRTCATACTHTCIRVVHPVFYESCFSHALASRNTTESANWWSAIARCVWFLYIKLFDGGGFSLCSTDDVHCWRTLLSQLSVTRF